jgi:hypothetical protein
MLTARGILSMIYETFFVLSTTPTIVSEAPSAMSISAASVLVTMIRSGLQGNMACLPSDCVIVTGIQDDPEGTGAAVYASVGAGVLAVTGVPVLFFSLVPVHPVQTARMSTIVTRITMMGCL